MGEVGLEPTRIAPSAPKAGAFANFAIRPYYFAPIYIIFFRFNPIIKKIIKNKMPKLLFDEFFI